MNIYLLRYLYNRPAVTRQPCVLALLVGTGVCLCLLLLQPLQWCVTMVSFVYVFVYVKQNREARDCPYGFIMDHNVGHLTDLC